MKKMLLALVTACASMVSSSLKAELNWGVGDYTPVDWTPAENNLLLGNKAAFAGKLYTESKCSEDPATVTDGVVPGASCDYKKIYGIADNSSLTWDLGVASDIKSLRVFTRWGDGGRSGIGISSVKVWVDGAADWTTLEGTELTYWFNDNNKPAALYGVLTNVTGEAIAENVLKLQVNFGHQDNSGTGYVEFEAVSASELKPTPATAEFKPYSIGGNTQTFTAKVTNYGRFSSAATMTMELSTDAEFTTILSSDPVALSGDGDLNVEKQLTVSGLQPDTLYYSRLKVVNEKELTFVSETQQYSTIDTLVCLGIGYVPTETGVKATVVISSMDTASATIDFYANGAFVESRDISAAGNYDFDVTSSAATVALRAEISYDGRTVTKEVTAQKGASGYVLPDPSAHVTMATALKMKPGDTITLPSVLEPAHYLVLNQSFLSQQDNVFTAIKPGIVGIEVYGADGTLAMTMVVIVLPEKIGNGNIYIRAESNNQDWHSTANWTTVDGVVAADYPHNADDIAIIPRLSNAQYFKVKEDISLGGLYVGIIKSGVNSTYYIQRSDGVTVIPVVTFKRTDGEPVTIQICGNNQKDADNMRTGLQFGDGNNKLGFKYENDTVLDGGWDGFAARLAGGRPSYASNCTNEIPAGVTLTWRNIDNTGTSMGYTFAAPVLAGEGVVWNRSAANIRYEKASEDFTGVVRDSSHGNGNTDRSGPTYFHAAAVTNASAEVYGFVYNSSGAPSCSASGVGMLCTGWDPVHNCPAVHAWINWLPAHGVTLVNSTYRCGSTENSGYGVGNAEYKYTKSLTVGRGFSYVYRNQNRPNSSGHPINWFETDALVHQDKGTIRIDDYYRSEYEDPADTTNNVTILHGFNAMAVGGTGDSKTAKNYPILPWAVSPSRHTRKLDFLCVDANERVCDRYAVDEKPSDVPTGEDANVYTWQRDLALSESKVFNALTICNNTKLKTMGAGKTLTLTSGGLILLENTSSIGTKTGGDENGALVLGDATKPGYVFALATKPDDPNCVYAPTTAKGGLVFGYTGYALLAGDQTGVDDELVVNAGTLDLGSQDGTVACTLDVPVRILANATVKMNNAEISNSAIYFDDIAGYSGKVQLNADTTCKKLYVRDTPEESEWTSLPRGTYGATGSGAANIDDDRFTGSGVLSVAGDAIPGLLIIVR